jgi:hypothetical protein
MSNPPLVVKDERILSRYADCVMIAIAQVKENQVDAIVQKMNEDQVLFSSCSYFLSIA